MSPEVKPAGSQPATPRTSAGGRIRTSREIDILGSIVGTAVDILFIDCSPQQAAALPPELSALTDFELLSLRPAHQSRTSHPDLDLLMTLSKRGGDAITAFTAMAVPTFSCDWALTFVAGRPGLAQFSSPGAPAIEWNGWTPKRATRVLPGVYSGADASYQAIHVPLGERHVLLLGRTGGPAFHELEVMRVNRLLEVASRFVEMTAATTLFGVGGRPGL